MKPKIPNAIKSEIAMRMRNQLDISDLIAPYDIKGEDFSGAIIKHLSIPGEDISGTNFANATVGTESGETNLNRVIARHCCFKGAKFLGKVMARRANFSSSNLTGTYIPYCDYRLSDFTNCIFCGTVFSMSTELSLGAIFSEDFFRDLGKAFNLTITKNAGVSRRADVNNN